jgi:hypothetical protein
MSDMIGDPNAYLRELERDRNALLEALGYLANEAEAIAEMARPSIGNTNVACLLLRVENARAVIAEIQIPARAKEPK